jgi:hypothetical protein
MKDQSFYEFSVHTMNFGKERYALRIGPKNSPLEGLLIRSFEKKEDAQELADKLQATLDGFAE